MPRQALSLVLLFSVSLSARATVYGPIPTVCAAYDSTPLVFRARILQVTPVPLSPSPATEVTYPDGTKTTLHTVRSGGHIDRARLQVLEVFKGDPGPEITVLGSDQLFSKGGEFLVYAEPNAQKELAASIRARTGSLAYPQPAADLTWLRAYPTAPPTGSVFGTVNMGYGVTDIPNISVTAVTVMGLATRTASTAADHTYSIKDLPPGAYIVIANLPAGYATLDGSTAAVTVAAKGCAEVDWAIRHDNHIRGLVTDPAGSPVARVQVGLLRPAQNRTGFNAVAFQNTDTAGRYDFSKAEPGDYWVALNYDGPNNRDPYTPVYYPSGGQSAAQLIHLGPTDIRDNINLVLTPPLTPVTLHLHIVNPDGSPVIRAHVAAIDPLTPNQFIGATANANGDADITLYEGRTYNIEADTSGYREPACAGPVKFIAKEGLQLDTLTLDKTISACRALEHAK